MNDTTPQSEALAQHQWERLHINHEIGVESRRCTACAVRAERRWDQRPQYGFTEWIEWRAPDGRTWWTAPGSYGEAPSCPLPGVEALCPWDDRAVRYAGPKGDVQLATAMRTW